jgi:hypothetical protein
LRPDILFAGNAGNFVFHLRTNGVSYQLSKGQSSEASQCQDFFKAFRSGEVERKEVACSVYRVDLSWLDCNNSSVVLKDNVLPGCTNYYYEGLPAGALNVRSYTGVTYKELYNGIDLRFYTAGGDLKYDFVVSAGSDYRQVRIRVDGAESINIAGDGSLELVTAFGTVNEGAPLVSQQGKRLNASWSVSGNVLSFNVEGVQSDLPLIIDPPVRAWGTYYGGTGDDAFLTTRVNGSDVFAVGYAGSGNNIATSGAHQNTYDNMLDGMVIKFDANGQRIWGTYYGGSNDDYMDDIAFDQAGNIFISGITASSSGTVIATSNGFQPFFSAGLFDAFMVKFDPGGVRQWGTYYGGTGFDLGFNCATDKSGNVYLSGSTNSGAGISTVGSHQPAFGGGTFDGFLVKFNTSGSRLWATYYGGSADEDGFACDTDTLENVYLAGGTASGSGIAAGVTHQTVYGGGSQDAYLVKFGNAGNRIWGSYFGGTGQENATGCVTDPEGNIYLSGNTTSTASIAYNAHQNAIGGGVDAFIVRFHGSGVTQYRSYYGGSGDDFGTGVSVDAAGNLYLCGNTESNGGTSVATSGAHQHMFGGGQQDAFLVKFKPYCISCGTSGVRDWGTYYGGTDDESGFSCAAGSAGEVYLSGTTGPDSGTIIASTGSHQQVWGGVNDAFLAKFVGCISPLNITPVSSQTLCAGASGSLTVSYQGTVEWFASATATQTIGTGTAFTIPVVSAGIYTFSHREAIVRSTAPL